MKSHKLKQAVDFHGHLGPYLVLGLIIGDLAVSIMRCKKHFGIKTIVKGAAQKPQSCLIDGLQLSTGCTYGKGNISKIKGKGIEVSVLREDSAKKLVFIFLPWLNKKLSGLKGHKHSGAFARKLLKINPLDLFELRS